MPETYFTIEFPDGRTETCYSPSSIVKKYFVPGDTLEIADFKQRANESLLEASNRVAAKFGFACTSANSQLAKINQWIDDMETGSIKIISVE
ncbi:MAG: MSMEG_0570 family nitrogen starvation response protein [Verrucomicrobiota bacterium]